VGVATFSGYLPLSDREFLIQNFMLRLIDRLNNPPGALGGELADACSTEAHLQGHLGSASFLDNAFNKDVSLLGRENMEIAKDLFCQHCSSGDFFDTVLGEQSLDSGRILH
jgi:hypothetical protein